LGQRRPLTRVRLWELDRLRRGYRFGLDPDEASFLGGRRALLHGLIAAVLGYIMMDLLLLVVVTVLGSVSELLLLRGTVLLEFTLFTISRPALPVLVIYGTAGLLAAVGYAE